MLRTKSVIGVAAAIVIGIGHDGHAQRGSRGFGGAAGSRGGAVVGLYGGGGAYTRSAGSVVGPAAGSRSAASGSGSYTTSRGTTIDYAGAARGGITPGGVSYGRGVGGVQITTPSGQTATEVGTAGAVAGPGGNAVAGRSRVAIGRGPGGSLSTAYHGGVALGPHGATAAGGRVGVTTGPIGTVSGATRTAVAARPYVATAYRGGVTVGPGGVAVSGAGAVRTVSGTYYRSAAALSSQAFAVRQNFRDFAVQYPALALRWAGPTWRPVVWSALASYGCYPTEPISYDYGETVVHEGDTVYVNGESAGTIEEYNQHATEIATAGKKAILKPIGEDFQPLGVFAMVGEGETKSTNIFQLVVNKDGVMRGEYYNALTDETSPVYGSVDKKTLRAAWTVSDRKTPVYEAGIVNLTKSETTMLAHYSTGKSQQFTLIRIEQPETESIGK